MLVTNGKKIARLAAAITAAAGIVASGAPAHADPPAPMVLTVDRFGLVNTLSTPSIFVAITGTASCAEAGVAHINVSVTQNDVTVGPIEDGVTCQPELPAEPWTSGIVTPTQFTPGPATVHVTGVVCETDLPDPTAEPACSTTDYTTTVLLRFPMANGRPIPPR